MLRKVFIVMSLSFLLFHNGINNLFVKNVNSISERPSETTYNQIIDSLHIDMTENEIVNLLGESYTIVRSSLTNEKMWRYTLSTNDNYTINDEADSVDIEGLLNGELEAIVFFTFAHNSKKLTNITVYFKNETGSIEELMIFEDGTVKKITIT